MKLFFTIVFLLFSHQHVAQAGVLLQGFYWDVPTPTNESWWDHLARNSQTLASSGFTAIWLPPVLKGASGGYSNGYDPYDDYDLGSKDQRSTYGTRWGHREQLMRAIAMLRVNGLDVYFDNVLGHRSGDDGFGQFIYKDSFGQSHGGRFPKNSDSFSGYNAFGRQLNHSNPYVREQLIHAGDWLINALGVQGMRIDMATNVSPDFLLSYLHTGAMSNSFTVSEYWSENLDELENYVVHKMQGRVSAFDFPLWGRLKDMTNASGFYDLRQLITAGLNSRRPNHSVTFVENHDTDRGFPMTQNKHLAYAYILTTEGYPSVFWKDYFNYGLKKIIDPLIWIHEKFAHGPLLWRYADEDLLIYERQSKPGLLVGMNDNQQFEKRQWVQTDFGAFVVLHDYTGNASDIRTEADGRVEVRVPQNSYVAYSPIGFHWGHELKSHLTHQQFAGAKDLDILPSLKNKSNTVGRVYVEAGTILQWTLFFETSQMGIASANDFHFQLLLKDANLKIIKEQKVFSQNKTQSEQVKVLKKGWYEFTIQLHSADEQVQEMPFWLNVTYTAPKTL